MGIPRECFGATFLQELLDTDAFPAHRHHLQLLVELETVTARLLEPLISGHELDDDRRQTATQAGEYARNMVKLTWGGFLTETRTIAAEALPRFRQLAVQGPDRTRATLSAVVEHEEVLLGFAELSLAANLRPRTRSSATTYAAIPAVANTTIRRKYQ